MCSPITSRGASFGLIALLVVPAKPAPSRSATVGNVVGPNSGTLATIVSQDPMYVSFPVPMRTAKGREVTLGEKESIR
ncbi:hypothetical protein [Mesorhizobium prunaredense]|uniref:hypothetical protein n=1 Tax=Mesorhizobium prunaredense TaxID=1631249 RepID=UPI00117C1081|nr:hypothetical protein [Mesorhizobium prunaredense]